MSCDIQGDERKNLYAFAARSLAGNDVQNILDIACGGGEGTAMLARAAPSACAIGLDIDAGLIGGAKRNFKFPNLQYVAGDARHTPFRDGEFDCITSFHTVEHFSAPDQKIFLGELRRILRSGPPASNREASRAGGKLCIATPDRDVWALQGIAGMQADHIKELSQKEFSGLVSAAGFRVESVYGQNVLKDNRPPFRPFLNFLKKIDVFRLRRLLGNAVIDRIDLETQPVYANTEVVALRNGEKASVTVLVCKKIR